MPRINPHGMPDTGMATLLQIILEGMVLHENSYITTPGGGGRYKLTTNDATTMAAKKILGDTAEMALPGFFCHLASHWCNDIQTVAAYYGMELIGEGPTLSVSYDVPQAPSLEHYRDAGEWKFMEPDVEEEDVASK